MIKILKNKVSLDQRKLKIRHSQSWDGANKVVGIELSLELIKK